MDSDFNSLTPDQLDYIAQITQVITRVPALHDELIFESRLDDGEDSLLRFIAEELKLFGEKH